MDRAVPARRRLRNILIPDVGERRAVHDRESRLPRPVRARDGDLRARVPRARLVGRAGSTRRWWSTRRGAIVDYLGTHQHLAVDLDLAVEPDGSLLLRSGRQRFREGWIDFRFPDAVLAVRRAARELRRGRRRLPSAPRGAQSGFGFLFGYEGWFACDFPDAGDGPPPRLLPLRRHEPRY